MPVRPPVFPPLPPQPKPPPPKPVHPVKFTIVMYLWIVDGGAENLFQDSTTFVGTLAGAKASLAKSKFYVAKIYNQFGLLEASVQGTQTKANPVPVS